MDLSLSPQDQAFRDEVRAFLDENLSEDLREAGRKTGGVFAEMEAGLRWHKVLAKRGWSAPTLGGIAVETIIWSSEDRNMPATSAAKISQTVRWFRTIGAPLAGADVERDMRGAPSA